MRKIRCSTGALLGKSNGADLKLLEIAISCLEYDGFEFMMLPLWYEKIEDITEYLISLSTIFPVFHCDKQIGDRISRGEFGDLDEALRLFQQNCWLASAIGARIIVMHLWGGLSSDRNIVHNINIYQPLYDICSNYDLELTIENVVCNHFTPMEHLVRLAERYPDIYFTFDTKMAAFHNQLELIYDKKYRWMWVNKHIRHLHINDYGGGYMEWENLKTLHIGYGNIDFYQFFEYLSTCGYDGDITIESTSFDRDGIINYDHLNQSARKVRDLMSTYSR